jgi:hypothetical protein
MLNNYPSDQMFIPLAMLFCASYEAEDHDEEYEEQFTAPKTWVDTCFANIEKPVAVLWVVIYAGLLYKLAKSK